MWWWFVWQRRLLVVVAQLRRGWAVPPHSGPFKVSSRICACAAAAIIFPIYLAGCETDCHPDCERPQFEPIRERTLWGDRDGRPTKENGSQQSMCQNPDPCFHSDLSSANAETWVKRKTTDRRQTGPVKNRLVASLRPLRGHQHGWKCFTLAPNGAVDRPVAAGRPPPK